MCIKCLMLDVLAEREAQFAAAGEEALARGEEIHETLAAAGTAQASQPEYDQYDLLEMERVRADIHNTNADAILKLAQAAKWLYDANHDTSGVLRTLEQLVYPAAPKTEPQPVSEGVAPETPAHDDVMEPLPKEMRDHIDRLRAAGFNVDVVRIPL